jgi:hypothetical protein
MYLASWRNCETLRAIKQQSSKSIFTFDEDTYKGVGYAADLQVRRKAGDAAGAYYYGVYNLCVCGGLDFADKERNLSGAVDQCLLESLESFKVASAGHMGVASFNIGRMYEKGWGVSPSQFVAADWFARAARQHNESGSRDEALASVEAALRVVPDHSEGRPGPRAAGHLRKPCPVCPGAGIPEAVGETCAWR